MDSAHEDFTYPWAVNSIIDMQLDELVIFILFSKMQNQNRKNMNVFSLFTPGGKGYFGPEEGYLSPV